MDRDSKALLIALYDLSDGQAYKTVQRDDLERYILSNRLRSMTPMQLTEYHHEVLARVAERRRANAN